LKQALSGVLTADQLMTFEEQRRDPMRRGPPPPREH
jgi:hypothetical protein